MLEGVVEGLLGGPAERTGKERQHKLNYDPRDKTILAVDDERQIVKLVEINLKKKGYKVICAYDGVEALEKVKAERPDMLVLDVMMPRMNGFDVLRTLQADPTYEQIPIIMLTAKAQDEDIFKGWESGVSSYLTKPFNPRELITFVERIFESIHNPSDDYQEAEQVWDV